MKRPKERFFLRLLILVFVLFVARPGHSAEVADRIVAIVNDDCVTLSELNEALEPFLLKMEKDGYPPGAAQQARFQLRQRVLDMMIDKKLTEQEAKKAAIFVQDKEVDQYLERTKAEHSMTEEDLRKALAADGYTLEEYRVQLKDRLLRMKLVNLHVKSKIAITEQDIKKYYEEHEEEYQGEKKYHLRTIFVKAPSSATADEKEAAREKIESVKAALDTGGPEAFDELATRFSEDASAAEGGDLGTFALGDLSERIREAISGMKAGEISPILEIPSGYQILMVQDIEAGPGKPLEDVKKEIQQKVYQKAVEEKYEVWIKKLRERSYVKIKQ
jgi:peptidyl-prolyl cis-trans isomerase SurA